MKLFSDLSDLEGVEKAEDILYMKILKKSTWIIDSWPKKPGESKLYRYYAIILQISSLIPGIIYLKNYTGKLSSFEMGHTYITVFMNSISLTRALMIIGPKYNDLLNYFLDEMHLFNYRNKSKYAYQAHILVHKISHFFTVYLLLMMVFGLILFNVTPMYNCYSNGMYRDEADRPPNATFDHAVFYELPFDYTTKVDGYMVVFIFNWYISVSCSTNFCVVDLTISLLVFHLWGHMRVLKQNLENMPKPAGYVSASNHYEDKRYTEEEAKEVHKQLTENIHYHSIIIDFQSRMSECFGEVLLVYFLFHQVSECLLMLECSQMNRQSLLRYGPLTVVIFQQLIQLSIIFELLGSSNDKLIDAVYLVPWEHMDTKNKKLVLKMLEQVQRSMNLKAMGMLTVGVQTMITILKTSFSYFVMLQTVAEEDE
uniref:Odorant receptor n=1 Tax=Agrotis segetum TaxID=47767 RepID=U5KJQ7_AGRSE|nr:olfactory receptor 4 [Agrotis segetum]